MCIFPPGPPVRCGVRPPRAIWAPGGPGPPRLRARPSAAGCPELPRPGAEGLAGLRAGRRGAGAGGRGARAALGPRTHAASRVARAFPSPAARSASRRDVTGRPPAPRSSGPSACGRRAHGPAGPADSGGRDPEEQRGAASEDGPRHAPGTPRVDFHAERMLAAPVTCGDTVGSTFHPVVTANLSEALTSGEGGCMDPLNSEWDFLKDFLGGKPSWKQRKNKHRISGWAEPCGRVATVWEQLHLGGLELFWTGKREFFFSVLKHQTPPPPPPATDLCDC
ncbi:collagen alpha-1(I) chain-like [Hippopotamus amphibius kiboko]|uniref:collagen alpha-1(I) chain-like n=1 Tax=Hippopotamus amphibius kiboko TaxID=575201 RepID=UPI002599572E|nr:collagen alpha-1(I) chain-like [Hippopotamus amphibius kiboko]